ncbi:hypothetical protein [Sedimenticola hydrogenitrophicus]|uniref:hypothetical protein n=1 Tax=Sedimenticola hydrogenitrophicus TaxID=2967975 RepID=UPI0021A82837|nr:hypothetical protein [Sedimenticola hydrogenitrophicus]
MNADHYSDEQLNAFIDNELAPQERLELLRAAADSDPLRSRLLQLQYLKELTRAAYPLSGPKNGERRALAAGGGLTRYLTAAAIGGLSLFAVQLVTEAPSTSDHNRRAPLAAIGDARTSQTRVVFHISSDSREDAALLLDQVETVLKEHRASGQPLRLEVVANNQGLRLMQQGRSPFPERIRRLSETYPNLVFAACGNTLERMAKETGEQIRIVPEAVIVRSGISYITRRQQTGWAYIKV